LDTIIFFSRGDEFLQEFDRRKWQKGDREHNHLGIESGDANVYRYVMNSPGDGVDPSGLIIVKARPFKADVTKKVPNKENHTTWGGYDVIIQWNLKPNR
jgi:hypothetical protein